MDLQVVGFSIHHRAGKIHHYADTLSRLIDANIQQGTKCRVAALTATSLGQQESCAPCVWQLACSHITMFLTFVLETMKSVLSNFLGQWRHQALQGRTDLSPSSGNTLLESSNRIPFVVAKTNAISVRAAERFGGARDKKSILGPWWHHICNKPPSLGPPFPFWGSNALKRCFPPLL